VTAKEMKQLKLDGGSGEMTKYEIPAFPAYNPGGTEKSSSDSKSMGGSGARQSSARLDGTERDSNNAAGRTGTATPKKAAPKKPEYAIGYDKSKGLWENIKSINIPGWLSQEWDKLDFSFLEGGAPSGKLTDTQKMALIKDNPDAQQQIMGSMGGPAAAEAAKAGAKDAAYAADRKEDYDKKQERQAQREGFLGEYKGFQGEAAGLGDKSQDLSEGAMTDASGKTEGQEGYDATTATRQGGFAGDVKKLGGYEQGFKDIAGASKTRGDTAQTQYGGAAETGAGKLEGIGDAYKETGKTMGEAAKTGQEGFQEGAQDVGTVKDQFGKEGFQKDVRGMSEKALSGEVGQREASMLKGRMEEGRMASQKGSEEKLRREMAQSGASPAEIAAKVAQFQRQSASQQSQAGRSETLSSQIQGQQMGQSALAQGAQLKGQEAGMAGKQAGLAVQQAALKGQGAAMQMQGAQGQQAALQGQGSMAQAGAGMRMQGVQGGAQLGFQGAAQQGSMLGQGMGAVQAAGGARQQQMGALDQQGGFIDQQGNYVQAQLQDTVAQETQAYSEEQARLTRKAAGTEDDPRYRPPAETAPAETTPAVATNTGGLPPGTTTAPPPGGINAAPAAPVQGYSKPTRPGMAQASIAQPGGLMAQQAQGTQAQAMTPEMAEAARKKQLAQQYSTGIPA
jgi:hypothetical protein